jgi:hypothetical protein
MSAKQKLNAANFLGSVLIAGLIGGVTGSFTVFGIALVAMMVAGVHSGDIRR